VTPQINLTKFGIPTDMQIHGTITSHKLDGCRLLFLFAERHTIKPGIRDHLMNAVNLCDRGLISCIGVEGWMDATTPCPCDEVKRIYEEQKNQARDIATIIDGILKAYPRRNFLFWHILKLLNPSLKIESLEDSDLFAQVAGLEPQYFGMRKDAIACYLRKSPLFAAGDANREIYIEEKATKQAEQEFAEHDLNLKRDEVFISKMLALWQGADKPAILNAGTSHQYRIARRLHNDPNLMDDVSYVLVEQP